MPDTPTYLAIAADIRERIRRGDEGWRPGDQIPGEDALAALFDCATGTVRQAVGRLKLEGLVRAQQRHGTHVRYIPPVLTLLDDRFRKSVREAGGAHGAYDAEMTAMGLRGHTRWLVPLGPVRCPGDDNPGRGQQTSAALLGVEPGDIVMVRARHMLAAPLLPDGRADARNEETLQLATSYLPWDIAALHPGLIGADSGVGGIYSRLEEVGHRVVRVRAFSSTRVGTVEECELLGIDPGYVQWMDRQAFDATGRVVEICRHVAPPGYFISVHDFPVDEPAAP